MKTKAEELLEKAKASKTTFNRRKRYIHITSNKHGDDSIVYPAQFTSKADSVIIPEFINFKKSLEKGLSVNDFTIEIIIKY